jgi:hypothetical protein
MRADSDYSVFNWSSFFVFSTLILWSIATAARLLRSRKSRFSELLLLLVTRLDTNGCFAFSHLMLGAWVYHLPLPPMISRVYQVSEQLERWIEKKCLPWFHILLSKCGSIPQLFHHIQIARSQSLAAGFALKSLKRTKQQQHKRK